jgi:murein DD-endopeptidase MepM/ murein hydrolase activator NlpD
MQNKNMTTLYSRVFNLYFIIACAILLVAIFVYKPNYHIAVIANNWAENILSPSEKTSVIRLTQGNYIDIKVKKGDTFANILAEIGASKDEIHNISKTLNPIYNIRKLSIGQRIAVLFDHVDEDNNLAIKIQSFKIHMSVAKAVELTRKASGGFSAKLIELPLERYIVRAKGKIDSSILATATKLGIPNESMLDVIKAYSYDIDFQRDIQPGDELDVFYEKFYTEDGEYSHQGKILFSSINLSDRQVNLYYYTNREGECDYYNEDGSSVKKELLRTPLNIARVSSGFGMRKHPILGFSKMHTGIDFGASIGTPILAAGSGTIVEMGHKGAYGNYIKIRHNGTYSTAYAHISSFARKLRKGHKVKQGEVIAYVGATGRATGPHLHYEVLVNDKHINPLKMKLASSKKLAGKDLESFKEYKKRVTTMIAKVEHNDEIAYNNFATRSMKAKGSKG